MHKRFDYGLIFMEKLKASSDCFLDVRQIAKENNIPGAYLEKIAQELKREGWVESRRGLGGGYRMSKENISMVDLINFFERPFEICPIKRALEKNRK